MTKPAAGHSAIETTEENRTVTPPEGNRTLLSDTARQAAGRLAAMLEPKARERAQRRGRLEGLYVTSHLHEEVELAVEDLVQNLAASADGISGKRRALVLIGESGSGKSTVIERTILRRSELQPHRDEYGELIRSMISFDCPNPVTGKLFARKLIETAGYPLDTSRLAEYELFELAKSVLRERQVLLVVVDEAQHFLKGNDSKTIENLANIVKSLLQIDGWPLHLVLAGVPTLAAFLEAEPQLLNRSTVVELEALTFPADLERVRTIVRGVVEKHAQMKTSPKVVADEFVHRIIHAGAGGFGTIIQIVRSACETAIRVDSVTVDPNHFARAFALMSGCSPRSNIFLSADWQRLSPAAGVTEIAVRQQHSDNRAEARRRNRAKGGK